MKYEMQVIYVSLLLSVALHLGFLIQVWITEDNTGVTANGTTSRTLILLPSNAGNLAPIDESGGERRTVTVQRKEKSKQAVQGPKTSPAAAEAAVRPIVSATTIPAESVVQEARPEVSSLPKALGSSLSQTDSDVDLKPGRRSDLPDESASAEPDAPDEIVRDQVIGDADTGVNNGPTDEMKSVLALLRQGAISSATRAEASPLLSQASIGPELPQRYLDELQALISQSRRYPKRAIRQRQEGVVWVGFKLDADGTFDEVRLIESSGYTTLDSAALSTIKGIKKFKPLPEDFSPELLSLRLPIQYVIR
ncbi:MAG: hypothetical protein C9356_02260 [Oleiphilus sp.]|nr:MAG: hypothetical protein C9356_02260 [Oleiphilus sp.]